jgi:hypothetical protein
MIKSAPPGFSAAFFLVKHDCMNIRGLGRQFHDAYPFDRSAGHNKISRTKNGGVPHFRDRSGPSGGYSQTACNDPEQTHCPAR